MPERASRMMAAGMAAGAALAALVVVTAPARAAGGAEPAVAAASESFPVATAARLGGDERQTRLVFDLTEKIELHAFTLADPYRVVVDLPQVIFNLPLKAGESGRGLVKAYRYGLVHKGGSRIVLDVTKPVRAKAFVLDATGEQPARLVLDLAATDRESYLRTIALENRVAVAAPAVPSEAPPAKSGDPRPIIVLDPGHGGIDNGTKAPSGETEKSITLDFSKLLRDVLEKSGRYRVVMTRTDDTFIPLADRVRLARERHASLFISIHADALRRAEGDAQGASVYTLSEQATDTEAAHLAESENKADVIAGIDLTAEPDDVADILIDLAQRETKSFSVKFAHTLVHDLKPVTRLHKRPLKSAGFKVLKAPDVPSVLVELGYVTNRADLKALLSGTWRQKTADSIVRAVDSFFGTRIIAGASPGAR